MAALTSHACKKWTTVIGMFLTLSPMGFVWYWGNLSIYLNSYLIVREGQTSWLTGPWHLVGFDIGSCLGAFICDVMIASCGKKAASVCGMLLGSFGLVLRYLTIGMNAVAMNIILGVAVAMGRFLMLGVIMIYCVDWATNNDFGFLSSIAQAGSPAGAIAINHILTFYINPDNETPDESLGPLRYFSQDEVLDRVPFAFLLLATVVSSTCLVSFGMMRENPEKSRNVTDMSNPNTNSNANSDNNYKHQIQIDRTITNGADQHTMIEIVQQQRKSIDDRRSATETAFYGAIELETIKEHTAAAGVLPNKCEGEEKEIQPTETEAVKEFRGYKTLNGYLPKIPKTFTERVTNYVKKTFTMTSEKQSNAVPYEGQQTTDLQVEDLPTPSQGESEINKTSSQNDKLSWKEIIQNPSYTQYCVLGLFADANYTVLSTYYKVYGQVYIHDDHWITDISTGIFITMFLSRTAWGKILDRLGSKIAFITLFSSAGISTMLFYFAPMINPWCYLVMTFIFAATGSPIYAFLIYACRQTFGKSNLVMSFGMVLVPMTVGITVSSHLLELILDSGGWFWLFCAGTSCNTLGLILSITWLPSENRSPNSV